jgi:hypothetical protein
MRNSPRVQLFWSTVAKIVDQGFWDQGTANYLLGFDENYYVQRLKGEHDNRHGAGFREATRLKVTRSLGRLDDKIHKTMVTPEEFKKMRGT